MLKFLIKSLLVSIALILSFMGFGTIVEQVNQNKSASIKSDIASPSVPTAIPLITEIQSPNLTLQPTNISQIKTVQPPSQPLTVNGEWEQTVEGKTTWSYIPRDDRMSTAEELFEAMNSYRRSQALQEVVKNDTLCAVAQNRANELQALGKLDDHAGFEKYARSQKEFDTMDEILYGGVQPQSGVHIVEYGWDRSLTGHRNALQNRMLTHGCGGIAGYFAVFEFGGN